MPPARAPVDDLHAGALLGPYGLGRDRKKTWPKCVPFYSYTSTKHAFGVFQLNSAFLMLKE